MKRGEVYQTGPVIPNECWTEQPPLIYITGPDSAIYVDGSPADPNFERETLESRGTIHERDLCKIERKGQRKGR